MQLVRLLASKGITNQAVLQAIAKIPRHLFLDSAFADHAYIDKPFAIGEGQTISQPYTVARQTELLEVAPGDKVLEIGTGSGYQTSILLVLGAKVYSIEYHESLSQKAAQMLDKLGLKAELFVGDGSTGLPQFAPYDKILVTAGAASTPVEYIDQLKIGGKLVIPVGPESGQKMLRITKKSPTQVVEEEFGYFCFVPLLGKYQWKT